MPITAAQTLAILNQLETWQGLARPDSPGYEALLSLNWTSAGREIGLNGEPHNPWNSLIRRSRLFEATAPSGEKCLGFFVEGRPYEGDLFLAPRCRSHQTAFRIEMPAVFRAYRHCTDPLADGSLTLIRAHLLDEGGRVRSRSFVRACDLWRPQDRAWDPGEVERYLNDPALLSSWSGVSVTRAFDASDVRWIPSDWVRFLLRGGEGVEGALAAHRLGMTWLLAEEDASERHVRPILSYSSLTGTALP